MTLRLQMPCFVGKISMVTSDNLRIPKILRFCRLDKRLNHSEYPQERALLKRQNVSSHCYMRK